ncbi:uncharacterized protein PV07_08955 [Cladophialophora immunda]|uniref:DUF7924 domain-containing protein n=1 Tax=Cladophialophora immunda TaxID=569365 RepID=A0A0D2ALA5_9EURO|nr:uncharacterized protein PV07_08955 [Cladophialophora immunda]KIW25812.1 hypothetical protein PV07_08955 [Cladophialophora immunda]
MAPRHSYKARRRSVKGNHAKSAPKNEDLLISHPRHLQSSITATVQDPLPSPQALIPRPVTRAQTRKLIAEAKSPQEPLRRDSSSPTIPARASGEHIDSSHIRKDLEPNYPPDGHSNKQLRQYVPGLKLSRENLKKLQRQLHSASSEMSPVPATRGGKRGGKRGARLTRATLTQSELPRDSATETTTSISPARYRQETLANVKIFVKNMVPPQDIRSQVDAIFNRGISKERRNEISKIAKRMSKHFEAVATSNRREDDYIEVVVSALMALDEEIVFDFVRKADLNSSLIPKLPQLSSNNEADHISDRPTERQRANTDTKEPSDASQSDVLTSESEPYSGVKTPRPDCTIGFKVSTISDVLSNHGICTSQVETLLTTLQCEHILYSDPTANFTFVRFPTLVVEGKAYGTGKTMYEAENQAAVAASCMINLFRQLDDVHDRYAPDSPCGRKTPVVFSIAIWGPMINLWVHYPLVEKNITSYRMSVLKTYNASVPGDLEIFLSMAEQFMSWSQEDILTGITGQLLAIAERAPFM